MIRYTLLLLFVGLAFWTCAEDEEHLAEDCAGVTGGDNICGCTDSTASNFDTLATFDDGSCVDCAGVAGGDNIDSLTEFNDNNKTIKVWRQGGACGSTQTIYRQQSDLEFHPTIYTEWESYTNGVRRICVASEFDISNGEKALKSKTESYWDSEKSKNIELGTKYY